MNKLTVYGLPLNPTSLLNQLAGASFCVSYATRDKLGAQLDQAIELVGHDGILLVDNGAFSMWKQGINTRGEDYQDAYEDWANDILARCDQAIAVIPDVIDGNEFDNAELVNETMLDRDRAMPIWHMHESLEYLTYLCESFNYVGIGSSGQFKDPGTPAWHARMAEAFAAIAKWELEGEGAYIRPRIHLMRAQAFAHLYPVDSSDSTNVAVNHNRQARVSGENLAQFAGRVDRRIQASAGPEAEHQVKQPLLDHLQGQSHDVLLIAQLADRLGYWPEHLEAEELADMRQAA
jgi:hypothetical protein